MLTGRRRLLGRLATLLTGAAALALTGCGGSSSSSASWGSSGTSNPSAAKTATSSPQQSSDRSSAGAPASGPGDPPGADAEVTRLAALGRPIYCAGHRGNAVAFTFDDGPGPYTHYALKKLGQAGQRATFFVVGRNIDTFPGYLQRELRLADLGDHTWTHPLLTSLSSGELDTQITSTAQKIQTVTGIHVHLFRPPYGAHNPAIDATARQLGLLEVLWNVDSADSLGANYAGIIRNVEAGLHPGSIILMHENRGQTIRALTTILPELQRRHMRSVSVPELLAEDPPSAAQLRAGPDGCATGAAARHGSGG